MFVAGFNVQGAKGWRPKAKRWHPCLRKSVRKFIVSRVVADFLLDSFFFYCYPNATIVLLFANGAWRCKFNIYFFSVYVAEKKIEKEFILQIFFANF